MTAMKNLRELFVYEMRDLYDAEKQVTQALPKMIDAATAGELKATLKNHLVETNMHVSRLEQAFQALGEKPKSITCYGMKGLIDEGSRLIKDQPRSEVLDAALVTAAQKVEHYEIAAYGTLRAYARLLGEEIVDKLLLQTLDEEGRADQTLNQLAMATINPAANSHNGR